MTELKYALECGVAVETKELNDGSIQASWANGQCVEIISANEAKELGLINTLKTTMMLGESEIRNITEKEVYEILEIELNHPNAEHAIDLEFKTIPTLEEAKTIKSMFNKSDRTNLYESRNNRNGSTVSIWVKSVDGNLSKNAQSKFKKFISVGKELGFIK